MLDVPWWGSGQDSPFTAEGPSSIPAWGTTILQATDHGPKNSIIFKNLKNDTNEFIYKRETDSQTQKTNDGYQRGKGGEG